MILGSQLDFSCSQCAAAPHLQTIQGCFEPAPRVFARLADFTFDRCPLTYQSPEALAIYAGARDGELEGADVWTIPAKRLSALRYAVRLLEVRTPDGH